MEVEALGRKLEDPGLPTDTTLAAKSLPTGVEIESTRRDGK